MNFLAYIAGAITAAFVVVGAFFSHPAPTPPPSFGATNAGASPLFDTVLSQQLGTSDTTMYLKSMTDSQGNVLSGYQCMTVDVNSPSVEYLCGTVSGTTLTGLLRNLSYQTGTTTYATPTNIHRVGADVRITDFPALTVLTNQALGKDTFANPLSYSAHPCSVSSASGTICDKFYIDNQIAAGGSPLSSTVAGIGLLATALQAASSTGTGVVNAVTYDRLLWASYATDTPQNCTTSSPCVPLTAPSGFLRQTFLDLTQAFTWTGLHIFSGGFMSTASSTINATTTIAASSVTNNALVLNGVKYAFPSANGTNGQFLQESSTAGILQWGSPMKIALATTSISYSSPSQNVDYSLASTTIAGNTIGTGMIHSRTLLTNVENNTSNTITFGCEYGGTTYASVTFSNSAVTTTYDGTLDCYLMSSGGTGGQIGYAVLLMSPHYTAGATAYGASGSGTASIDSTVSQTWNVGFKDGGAGSTGEKATALFTVFDKTQ